MPKASQKARREVSMERLLGPISLYIYLIGRELCLDKNSLLYTLTNTP